MGRQDVIEQQTATSREKRQLRPQRRHTLPITAHCVLTTGMIHCMATVLAKGEAVAEMTSGMVGLRETVVTFGYPGSDFQKRMLRSRRSPYSASSQ